MGSINTTQALFGIPNGILLEHSDIDMSAAKVTAADSSNSSWQQQQKWACLVPRSLRLAATAAVGAITNMRPPRVGPLLPVCGCGHRRLWSVVLGTPSVTKALSANINANMESVVLLLSALQGGVPPRC